MQHHVCAFCDGASSTESVCSCAELQSRRVPAGGVGGEREPRYIAFHSEGGANKSVTCALYIPVGGCTHVMPCRGRMIIDVRIPTIPGRSTSGFHRPGRHCLHQARSAVRCWASRTKGELHPTQHRFLGGHSCMLMILACG